MGIVVNKACISINHLNEIKKGDKIIDIRDNSYYKVFYLGNVKVYCHKYKIKEGWHLENKEYSFDVNTLINNFLLINGVLYSKEVVRRNKNIKWRTK